MPGGDVERGMRVRPRSDFFDGDGDWPPTPTPAATTFKACSTVSVPSSTSICSDSGSDGRDAASDGHNPSPDVDEAVGATGAVVFDPDTRGELTAGIDLTGLNPAVPVVLTDDSGVASGVGGSAAASEKERWKSLESAACADDGERDSPLGAGELPKLEVGDASPLVPNTGGTTGHRANERVCLSVCV